jgi:O-antigen/teichoic acid export membrane protein
MHRYVRGAGRFLLVTLLPTSVAVALTAPEIMVLLYSDRYVGGALFLALQVFAFSAIGAAIVFGEMLIARGDATLAAGLAAALVPVALGANLLLLPGLGAMGSATALLVTGLGLAGATAFFVVRRFGPLLDLATFGRVALATIAMMLVATQVHLTGSWLLAKYAVLFGTYGGVLVLLGELTWSDLHPFALWRAERA